MPCVLWLYFEFLLWCWYSWKVCVRLQRWEDPRAGRVQGGSLLLFCLVGAVRDSLWIEHYKVAGQPLLWVSLRLQLDCGWTGNYSCKNKYLLRTIWILMSLMPDAVLLVICFCLNKLVSEVRSMRFLLALRKRIDGLITLKHKRL